MPGDYLRPYRDAARRGTGFGVTLWASPAHQRRRFAAFARMYRFAGKRILDAGCSRGDFAAFLVEREIPFAAYTGVDALAPVIEFAQQRRLPRCEFVVGDFLATPALLAAGEPDVICISGALNTMTDAQVTALLGHALAAARHALIFNFLSDRAAPRAPFQFGAV